MTQRTRMNSPHIGKLADNWGPLRRRAMMARFRIVPYPNAMGMKIKSLGAGASQLSMKIATRHRQYQGIIHGGALAGLADTAATFAALTILPDGMDLVTIEFKVNFLAGVSKGTIVAEGSIVRMGSRVSVAEVRLYAQGSGGPILTGTFTMLNFIKPATTSR